MADKIYRKLAQRLDTIPNGFGDSGLGASETSREELLARIFTPEEAALGCVMRLTPEPAVTIAARVGMPDKVAYRVLNGMYRKGLIAARIEQDQIWFGLMPWAVGIYEEQLPRLNEEMAVWFERMYVAACGGGSVTHSMPALMRVVPADNTLPVDHQVMPYEQVMAIVEAAGEWGVRNCICHTQQTLIGKGCDRPIETCLILSPQPGGLDLRGSTRPISLQEAGRIVHLSEEAGLVHMVGNHQTGHHYICNCCACCCTIMRSVSQFDVPAVALSSDFYAGVDAQACVGCGECLPRCQLKALSVPQTVCLVNYERCVGCGLCTQTCPTGALKLIRRPEGQIPPLPLDEEDWMGQRARNRGIHMEDIL